MAGRRGSQSAPDEGSGKANRIGGVVVRDQVRRAVSDLEPHARNARTHDAKQVDQIVGLIRRFGWTNPILIDENGVIIAGHGRVLAATQLRMAEVPCIVLGGLSDREKRELMLADNKITLNAGWNADLLRSELAELRGKGADLEALGFAAAELSSLMPEEEEPEVVSFDIGAVNDKFWISVKGPLSSQAAALQALRVVMKDIPGVTVDLGTVESV